MSNIMSIASLVLQREAERKANEDQTRRGGRKRKVQNGPSKVHLQSDI